MTATTFPLFKELPLELQTMIWEMGLETKDEHIPRLEHFCYNIVRYKGSTWCHKFTGPRRGKVVYYDGHPCALKDVCRLSRLIVLRRWLRELKTVPLYRYSYSYRGMEAAIDISEDLVKESRRRAALNLGKHGRLSLR